MKAVCFNAGHEEFGLDVNQVLGINPMLEIMRVPRTPHFVEGVIRIKGKVIPVIDLRKRLGIEKRENRMSSRIVIAKVSGVRTGMIVDGVSGVIDIPAKNLEPPSKVINHTSVLKAVGNLEKRILLLLDMDKLLSRGEAKTLAGVHKLVES